MQPLLETYSGFDGVWVAFHSMGIANDPGAEVCWNAHVDQVPRELNHLINEMEKSSSSSF